MGRKKKTKQRDENFLNGSIEQRTLISEANVITSIISWKIFNYDELNYDVIYYKMYESHDFSCVFKLFKTNHNLHLAVRCPTIHRPSLFHLPYGIRPECSASYEIARGLYVGQFRHAFIFARYGEFRETGVVTVVFVIKPENMFFYNRNNKHLKFGPFLDFNYLCTDMRKMYLEGVNSDFVINAGEVSFKVHKHILMVRSNSFMEFFKKRNHPNECTINTSSAVMHLVLYYCYSGELPSASMDCLVDVLNIANDLKILSLVERCNEELGVNEEFEDDIRFMEELLTKLSFENVKSDVDSESN